MCIVNLKLLAYAHDRRKVVLRGGWDLLTGRPDVLDGVVKVTQLCCDGPLVHCTNHKRRQKKSLSRTRTVQIRRLMTSTQKKMAN